MRLLVLFCVSLIFASSGLSQEHTQPKVIIIPRSNPNAPTLGQYEKVYNDLEIMVNNAFDEEKWEEVSFTHRVTKQKKTWAEFSDIEKKAFCLLMSEQLYERLNYIHNAWNWELNKFANPAYKPEIVEDEENPKNNTASHEDVEKWIEKLTFLRGQFAVKIELETVKFFKQSKIPTVEQEKHLQELRERHDEDKLIDRTKE